MESGRRPAALVTLLAPFWAAPGASGVFSDFDGTLAPIVDDPTRSRPVPGAVEALTDLAGTLGRVAVVSGRPGDFLAAHLGGRGIELWGLYGLERVGEGGEVVPFPAAERWRVVVDEVVERAGRELAPGVGVEHKGMSVTLHYRTDPALEPAARRWAEEAAAETGLGLHLARKSFELRPPLPRDKGTVVAELAAGLDAACFLGDDQGDLDAFDALDRLAADGAATLRVGVRSPEAPAELLERADVVVEGPEGVVAVLDTLRAGPPS